MTPLTIMPKFGIIQYKCTYGFTQTPLISMSPNIVLRNCCFFYLSDKPKLPIKPNDPPQKLNEPVLVNIKIADNFMYSVQ